MGSSSGVTRGQLRPQFAGRNPPFLVAALFICLGLLGVSYFSLSSQYTSIHNQLENVIKSEERERSGYQAKSKENEIMQKTIVQLREKLDRKFNELKIKQNELEEIRKSQQMTETSIAAEKRKLEIENKGLTEKTSQLEKSIDIINEENSKLKGQLETSEKQIKEKEAKIEQLNSKINELSVSKVLPDKQQQQQQQDNQEVKASVPDDKDAPELRTEEPTDLGMADGDNPNGPADNPGNNNNNKMADGPVDGPIDTNNVNPENHAKSSLSKLVVKNVVDGEPGASLA